MSSVGTIGRQPAEGALVGALLPSDEVASTWHLSHPRAGAHQFGRSSLAVRAPMEEPMGEPSTAWLHMSTLMLVAHNLHQAVDRAPKADPRPAA